MGANNFFHIDKEKVHDCPKCDHDKRKQVGTDTTGAVALQNDVDIQDQ